MQSAVWRDALAKSADPPRAEHYFAQLKATSAAAALKKSSREHARILAALFSGSQALSEWLIANPEWTTFILDPELLQGTRQKQGLLREVNGWLPKMLQGKDYANAFGHLRQFKQKEMLRVAARDLAHLASTTDILTEISNIADVTLESAFLICNQQHSERLGRPHHLDASGQWKPTAFCILGLGKLGGQELNYSSDIDLLFIYGDEGFAFREPPRKSQTSGKSLSNHQFFVRLCENIITEVSRLGAEGSLYRVDMRLRPEGNAGPLARSLSSYENYYSQWGQTWERMMLIKARSVAGDAGLAAEFLEMIQPFRYPRSLNERALRDMAAMKQRIEDEVLKTGESERNVKLGRGGIREIEFVAQILQLLHAGRQPFLQDAQTLPALQKLVRYKLLSPEDAGTLAQAYCFLRDIEHRLQMENNLQTHTIPTERKARERLALLMDFKSLQEFEAAKRRQNDNVRRIYDNTLRAEPSSAKSGLPDLDRAPDEWIQLLAEHQFRDPQKAFQLLKEFVRGPGYVHVSSRTSELALQLAPRLLALCLRKNGVTESKTFSPLSDPDRVLNRLDRFVSAYGSRAMLYELWTSNPSLFQLLVLLFDRSEFLAEMAIRTPDLVDELELSGRLRRHKTTEEILRDLMHGIEDKDQSLWLRRYHQAEFMRIGLRDILGLADFERNLGELSNLAEACLQYALEVVTRKYKMREPPFAIIGLGKLGGAELNYGSDLDILFVADNQPANLPQRQKVAAEILDLLSRKTEAGMVFEMDARLRPDGEKGLLVNTLDAHEDYYRNRAQLWELQSLSRARPVAGSKATGAAFQELAGRLTNFQSPSLPMAAYTPDWKSEVARMRQRIEKERTPTGKQELAIKTGTGGLMDAEFISQTLCLAHGWQEPNTLRGLMLARETGVVPQQETDALIENYRKLRRVEGILRRWSYAGETLLPDDPAALLRVAIRCGFMDAESFIDTLNGYRAAIRQVYNQVMPAGSP